MKGAFIKLLCIAGAWVAGSVMIGHPVAGVLTAPFGWIAGRAMELHSEAKRLWKETSLCTTGYDIQKHNWLDELFDPPNYSPWDARSPFFEPEEN